MEAASEKAERKARLDMLKRMNGGGSDEEGFDDDGEGQTQEDFDALSEEQQMAQMLGFGGFDTTKGKEVADNSSTAARGATSKTKRREYKQV